MLSFTRLSLARQFLVASLIIMLIGMLLIGFFVGEQIESGVINQAAVVSALYMDSFIAPIVQEVPIEEAPDGIHPTNTDHLEELDHLLAETPLGQNVVAFKLWLADGEVIYSPTLDLVGVHFPMTKELTDAFSGEVVSGISQLEGSEHIYEREYWDALIETFSPVRSKETGEVIAVAEFYILPDKLQEEIRAAQIQSWTVVGSATLVMYLLLAGIVGRASRTIFVQQDELQDNITQLKDLLSQNERLRKRVHRAAARTTALNEQYLRRISSDLHDGPTQDLALALLRIDPLSEAVLDKSEHKLNGDEIDKDLNTIQNSLESAIKEIRAISSGLLIPALENLSPVEVVERAISDYQQKTNKKVDFEVVRIPPSATHSVKITLYRLVQEGLTNSFRHTDNADQYVKLRGDKGQIEVEIADDGSGFDVSAIDNADHLGLVGMRERVEVLGGEFEVITGQAQGTKIIACLPIIAADNTTEDSDA